MRSEESARRAKAAWRLRLIGGLRDRVVVVGLVAPAGVRFETQLDSWALCGLLLGG